jgi:hypothetical protein
MEIPTPAEPLAPDNLTANSVPPSQAPPASNNGTITASQLAAFFSLVFGGILYVAKLAKTLRRDNLSIPQIENIFAIEFYSVLLITSIYYVISEWAAEEADSAALRSLKCAKREFWLRVVLSIFLVFVATALPQFSDELDMTPLHAQALGLAILYCLFLAWDLLVTHYGHNLSNWLLLGDFLGGLLTISLLWCHWLVPFVGIILLIFMLMVSSVSMVDSARKFKLMERIFTRTLQS